MIKCWFNSCVELDICFKANKGKPDLMRSLVQGKKSSRQL